MRDSLSIYPHKPIDIFGEPTPTFFNFNQVGTTTKKADLFIDWQVREQLKEPHRQTKQQQFVKQHEKSPPVREAHYEPEEKSHSIRHVEQPTNPHPLKANNPQLPDKVTSSNRELFRLKAVFPFDFFPDEIKIKEHKVIIIQRSFFGSGEIRSFDPQEIAEVSLMDTPFFASIRFNVRTFVNNMVIVRFLKKTDALTARSLIEGLASMIEHKVNTTDMTIEEIKHKAMSLGGGKQYA